MRENAPGILQIVESQQICSPEACCIGQSAASHHHSIRTGFQRARKDLPDGALGFPQRMWCAQAHDRLPFIDGAHNGIRTLSGQGQILLDPLFHYPHIRAAQHPQLMNRCNVHMKDLRQTAHFQRLGLQNCPQQFMNRHSTMLISPDIDADSHDIRRLLHQRSSQRSADLDQRQTERLRQIRVDRNAGHFRIRKEGTGHAGLFSRKRQTAFYPIPDRILHTAEPSRKIQDVAFMGSQYRGAPQLSAQHLQCGPYRLLVVRR